MCAAHLILSMPRLVSFSPPRCTLPFPSQSCHSTLQSPLELPPHATVDLGCRSSKCHCSCPQAPPSSPCRTASSTGSRGESLKHLIADHLRSWPILDTTSLSLPSSPCCSSTHEQGISPACTGWHQWASPLSCRRHGAARPVISWPPQPPKVNPYAVSLFLVPPSATSSLTITGIGRAPSAWAPWELPCFWVLGLDAETRRASWLGLARSWPSATVPFIIFILN
jgi:hypothetical protein